MNIRSTIENRYLQFGHCVADCWYCKTKDADDVTNLCRYHKKLYYNFLYETRTMAMGYYQENSIKTVALDVKKYAVMKTTGVYVTSFDKENDAISFCKKEVKLNNDLRFVVLEAKKEIGTKTPEIEVEDL